MCRIPEVFPTLAAAILLCFAVVTSAAVPGLVPVDENYSFEQYVVDFKKSYATEEDYNYRKSTFERNLAYIRNHNEAERKRTVVGGYMLGFNHFMDLETSELPLGYDKSVHAAWRKEQMLSAAASSKLSVEHTFQQDDLFDFDFEDPAVLPKAVDWRAKGVATPIKNQGSCGSCWAFASVSALESHIAINTGKLFSLSPQELVSCAPNPKHCGGGGGCGGSTAEIAFNYVAQHGIVDEWRFGYNSFDGKQVNCTLQEQAYIKTQPLSLKSRNLYGGRTLRGSSESLDRVNTVSGEISGAVATISGYANLPSNNYTVFMNVIAKHGPFAINIAANDWALYRGGVFHDDPHDPHSPHSSAATDINHLVVLMGYGTDQETGEDYWLVRNSWGPMWGEDGYIRLKRVDPSTLANPDDDCGMDARPADGIGCTKDDDGTDVDPPPVKVCGTSGVLFDGVVPLGGRLL